MLFFLRKWFGLYSFDIQGRCSVTTKLILIKTRETISPLDVSLHGMNLWVGPRFVALGCNSRCGLGYGLSLSQSRCLSELPKRNKNNVVGSGGLGEEILQKKEAVSCVHIGLLQSSHGTQYLN